MSEMLTVYIGEELASYHFGDSHPFGPKRHDAFYDEFTQRNLDTKTRIKTPVKGNEQQALLFHTREYVEKVKTRSVTGDGYLDQGDTPAIKGIFDAVCYVVGTVIDATDRIMAGEFNKAFIPIAGLHHARRHSAAGFCVFNDCGVAIEHLKQNYGLTRIAYVDIDAHHGDGVYYDFESDPCIIFADLHEDGRFLYPGTGRESETGSGAAVGTKLNIPMPMYANDDNMYEQWPKVETLLRQYKPEFIILQCGADSIKGDPITHMEYSDKAHAFAAERLCKLADEYAQGRMIALGGGGYNLDNIARGWNAVVEKMIEYA